MPPSTVKAAPLRHGASSRAEEPPLRAGPRASGAGLGAAGRGAGPGGGAAGRAGPGRAVAAPGMAARGPLRFGPLQLLLAAAGAAAAALDVCADAWVAAGYARAGHPGWAALGLALLAAASAATQACSWLWFRSDPAALRPELPRCLLAALHLLQLGFFYRYGPGEGPRFLLPPRPRPRAGTGPRPAQPRPPPAGRARTRPRGLLPSPGGGREPPARVLRFRSRGRAGRHPPARPASPCPWVLALRGVATSDSRNVETGRCLVFYSKYRACVRLCSQERRSAPETVEQSTDPVLASAPSFFQGAAWPWCSLPPH